MKRHFWLVASIAALLAGGCDSREPVGDSGSSDGGADASSEDALGEDAVGDVVADSQPDAHIEPCGDEVCDGTGGEDCATCPIDCGSCPIEWTALAVDEGLNLEAVHFPINAAVGFAVGSDGVVLKTVNGGTDWIRLPSDTTSALRDVDFVDEQTGYAVGHGGTVIKTTDGSSWSRLASVTNVELHGVDFVTAANGAVVGDGGTILTTTDGGGSWDAQSSNTDVALYGIHFVTPELGFAVGSAGTILRTANGGTSWAAITVGSSNTLRDVAFAPSGTTGFAVGDGGTILRTENGGSTWARQNSGTTANLWAVDMPLDGLHVHAVGEDGTILRTIDSGAIWQREDAGNENDLRGVVFPAYWSIGYAVGANSTVAKRVPQWSDSMVYDMEVANVAPPSLLVNADPMQRVVFVVNGRGQLFAIRPGDQIALYKPVALAGPAPKRGPVGTLPDEDRPSIFIGTLGGWGYAIDALSGVTRWTTDGNALIPGNQPLGDDLVAAPTIAAPHNLAFFGTHNQVGTTNRLFAVNAQTGSCEWVFNGDCNGGVSPLEVGQMAGGPIHDTAADRLYLATTKLADGRTVWALDTSAGSSGDVFWSRDLGGSSTPPAFAALDLASMYVGTINGRVYRLRTSDGDSCWATRGTGCSDATGDQEFFCTSTDVRASTCEGGSDVMSLWVMLSGTHQGRVVFLTQDGQLRMIDQDGQLVWKAAQPFPGASAPLVAVSEDTIYINSNDGNLRQLNLSTGAVTATQQVGDGRAVVGSPAYDSPGKTIYVGNGFGELHSFATPFD